MKFTQEEKRILEHAAQILESKAFEDTQFNNAIDVMSYCQYKLAHYEREVFGVIFLTAQHQVICFEEMFKGTINSASVYPREIVKRALEVNAAAIILAHNHPSGDPAPSIADQQVTDRIVNASKLLDIKVLDHVVVGLNDAVSFAQRGFL